jgi:hypothetical protein
MTAGLLAKTALFPLHLWLPPAHAGAPAAASALLSALVVKGSFFIVLRLWLEALPGVVSPAAAQVPPTGVPPAGQAGVSGDTLDPNWVPAGYGTLRQDDIALKSSPANGLQIRAIPLDERFIRLLSPDSYRSLRELQASKAQALLAVKERNRLPSYSIWYVSFFALEQGETRFSPQEFIISNTGRDFRPLDIVPLTPGFGEYRLKQREVQSALPGMTIQDRLGEAHP